MRGKVQLIGAGCGRGLISVKALKALKKADVLVYDDLIDDKLLGEVRDDCKRIYVGKRFAKHSKTQPEINEILIEEAKKGQLVARLKGGDSFVFGRGGEEYLALEAEGIDCELFPGISSCIVVPESLGIPVTHRGIAQSFTVITGHSASSKTESYEALAKLNGTLVFLMGINSIAEISENLIKNGKSPDLPASIVCRGFSGREKRIDGCLGDIAEKAKLAESPGILVVGEVAGFHMESKGKGPLDGKRVAITGTRSFTSRLTEHLEELGAFVESMVCLELAPNPGEIPEDFSDYGWIVFTSANGIDIFFDEIKARGMDIRCLGQLKFACIGTGTASKLREHGIIADLMPEKYTAASLGELLAEKCAGEKILILRALGGSPELNEKLEEKGVSFDDRKIYDTVQTGSDFDIKKFEDCHYLVFASAAGVRAFFESQKLPNAEIICIGDITAKELKKRTDREFSVAKEHSVQGIGRLLCELNK